MPRKPTPQQVFDDLLSRYEREVADAFRAAVADLRNAADLQRVIAALQSGDLQEAITAMHLDPAAFGDMQDAIARSYGAGGQSAASHMPGFTDAFGRAIVVRFDARNPRAEQWLSEHSSTLVTRILDDQRQGLRQVLTAGMVQGQNPRTVALDIVGRVDRTTGQRSGGIIGLTSQQTEFAANARAELASDDPALLRNYLGRELRDRRFDSTIQRAIREGRAPPADVAARAGQSYANRLLKLRGDTVGRTEALTSLHAGQEEAYDQAIAKGAVSASQVRSIWRSAMDSRVRETHRVLSGESVGHGEAFVSPSGARLRFPGDTSLGAGPAEVANCRCHLQKRIDFLANLG
jgi:hypothetical protein